MTEPRILRVFPRRTSHTPTDDLVRIGQPDLLPLPEFDEIRVSCVFTWDISDAELCADAWADVEPRHAVRLGGPAFGDGRGEFIPGRYVNPGISISSRGCPNNCPWCLVPKREGKLRLLPICPGHIIQDNNVTAWPRDHFRKLCEMLKTQKRGAEFRGGLEAQRFTDWHREQLRSVRIRQLWFACDEGAALTHVGRVAGMLDGLRRQQKRCYVLAAYEGDTVEWAEHRLEDVFRMGFIPFVQLYRGEASDGKFSKEWRDLRHTWSRPQIILARHAKEATE